jgi:hypothetical protein
MNKQSLKYIDSAKRRMLFLIGNNTAFSFINPLVYHSEYIYQVKVTEGVVSINDGDKWRITEDENLMCELIIKVLSKEKQKEIEFKEAV